MTFEQKTRTLAAAAGCLAVLGSAVCEAAEEGREAPQETANKDLPVKVCPSAPRQEASAMPSLESVIAVWGFPMKMLADGYVEYDGWVGRQEFGTVMAFWKADSRTSAWYGLMNYPEDLADLSLRFKYVRTTARPDSRSTAKAENCALSSACAPPPPSSRARCSPGVPSRASGSTSSTGTSTRRRPPRSRTAKARSLSAASPWRAAGPNNQPTKGRPEGRPFSLRKRPSVNSSHTCQTYDLRETLGLPDPPLFFDLNMHCRPSFLKCRPIFRTWKGRRSPHCPKSTRLSACRRSREPLRMHGRGKAFGRCAGVHKCP